MSTDLALDIKFTIDTRWDQLLTLEVSNVGNAQGCSGSTMAPNCIDPNDMESKAAWFFDVKIQYCGIKPQLPTRKGP